MSGSIEQRVVQMKFDTTQFGPKVQESLNHLAQLKEGLKLDGASKGLEEVSSAANKFSLDGMKNQLSGIAGHFTALQVAAVTALSNIVNRAVDAGLSIAKSLTIDPITSGFHEYETNLNSIQTILANTGLKGSEGLATVTDALDNLNHYADQTIYNFSEMTKNIGTFTAAGVKLDVATSAIKGIANLAAISGSNAEQASAAMYQLSQALAAGKVTLEDWNSVVNAGMGGKIFQDSLIETAKIHGVKIDEIIKKQGSFRLSLEKGWLTSDILTETLSKFTGELSAAQLTSMGYSEQQAQEILLMGQTAVDAATKVKTITQLMDTLREAVGSGWSKTWQILFGNFDEAKVLFTNVSNVLGKMIGDASDARNNLLQGWKDLGGRTVLIEGIGNAFTALMAVIKPVREAFSQVFPATTAKQLYDLTVTFRDFMGHLKLGEETANNLRRTFAGLFSILGIGWDLVKAGAKFIGDLIGKFSSGSGGILRFTGNIGDFLVALRKAIQDGEAFTKFFNFLSRVIDDVLGILSKVTNKIKELFAKLNLDPAEKSLSKVKDTLAPLASLGDQVSAVWSRVVVIITNGMTGLSHAASTVWNWVKQVGSAISDMLGGISFGDVLKGVNTGLLAALLLMLKNFLSNFSLFGGKGGFLDALKGSLEAFTGALKGMQNALNAAALLGIALAIGILTLSLVALSKIDSEGLTRASIAIAVMMGELAGAFIVFNKIGTTGSAVKIAVMSAGFIGLAIAIRILASAVDALSGLSIHELEKGLVGVAVLMGTLVASVNRLDTNTSGIIRTAAAMILLGAAVRILVFSVQELGTMDWQSLAKGLVGVAVLLGSLALFTKFSEADKGGLSQGVGLILLAVALKILASAVGDFVQYNWEQIARGMAGIAAGLAAMALSIAFLPPDSIFKAASILIVAAALKLIADGVAEMSKLSWMEIARGMTVMAGALLAIALAIAFLPPTAILSAAGILIVAVSLGMIQEALGKMSGMTWEEIGKGLVVLAGSLLVIAAAIFVVQGAVGGAVAIIIVAAALTLLVPVLQAFAAMSWEEIIKGLVGLAGIFVILGLAGYVLGPLSPVIIALAGAIALLGLAVLAAGLGMLAFATGLGILATVGAASGLVLVELVKAMIGLIPLVMEEIGKGLIAFAKIIATSGPAITEAIVTVLTSLLDAIKEMTPKIFDTLLVLLEGMLNFLISYVPKMVDAGLQIVTGVLDGVGQRVGDIVEKAVTLVVNFLGAIGDNLGRVIQAGVDLMLSAINGVADALRNNGKEVADAGFNLASGLIEGIVNGVKQLISRAVGAAAQIAKDMFDAAKRTLGINSPSKAFMWIMEMTIDGIVVAGDKYGHRATNAAAAIGDNMIDAMGESLSGLSKVLGSDLIDFNPTITPVLDLSMVKKDAAGLGDILRAQPIDTIKSFQTAQTASSGFEQNRQGENFPGGDIPGNVYNYTQNNTSPKPLNPEEVYRLTNNLISRRKGANA